MAVDNSKILFSTNWDIDQISNSGTANVGVGTTALYTFADINFPPVFEVMCLLAGGWQYPGINSSGQQFHAYIDGATLYISTNTACAVRYWLWTDKVTY